MNTSEQRPLKLAYRIDEIQEVSGIGRTKTYELIKQGKLRSIKVGRRRLVLADSLVELLSG